MQVIWWTWDSEFAEAFKKFHRIMTRIEGVLNSLYCLNIAIGFRRGSQNLVFLLLLNLGNLFAWDGHLQAGYWKRWCITTLRVLQCLGLRNVGDGASSFAILNFFAELKVLIAFLGRPNGKWGWKQKFGFVLLPFQGCKCVYSCIWSIGKLGFWF